jgi:transposase
MITYAKVPETITLAGHYYHDRAPVKGSKQALYTAINLEQRVRKNHILRKVKRQIDFDFIYNEVKDKYGIKGYESVVPPIILKIRSCC